VNTWTSGTSCVCPSPCSSPRAGAAQHPLWCYPCAASPAHSGRIWQAILELVAAIAKVFSIDDEEVMDALVNESEELAHICELYQCKMAS
jgi:hypothetical protein